jgi:hypothetical protein
MDNQEGRIVETAVEARAGLLGRPVLAESEATTDRNARSS